ncbi:MAG: hypothetical protein N0C81_06595 [Candidatus Thiodiazotropha lotti]|uniref:Alkyl hydroperoxide reductase subunit C/ Thiol specific antioxidant domain-containing protein n=1 Tax=Candidatus Thiodiazotropha lotti TaxID=2792787 RepID=A0A9E4K492_9GAMM|nr:hypothetical protein [Candidatus Thiodiazotropha lotti]MCG7920472.1 hypothetical protein [Candidatus Thiodiazotropha lotti]MCG7932531.1 hypothetical protein [Candidatus Thiodiazotropha lotti]MCG7938962.1 hypothetical protein [Candidatus Thiodiazotropha lotti]MCG8005933.1 hypothetical protein [Candidatus Thiodiazotropha lotti]
MKKKGNTHPVGIDLHLPGEEIPETMRAYQTRGTPEMAIINRSGMVRLQRFGDLTLHWVKS